ncbi:MAG: gamma-glutamyl-gamma-aminobutyrate hydrolase family protein [Lachnospirales bacterium]
MSLNPIILVASNLTEENYTLSVNYIRFVEASNLLPITTTNTNLDNIEKYVSMCDAVLLTGGGDINPDLFKDTIKKEYESFIDLVPIKRDLFEIRLVKEAIRQNKKIFGICRGMQVINVALGGNINQHIENHLDTVHRAKLREDSILSSYFNQSKIEVNSVHHQVVNKLGKGLIATAVSDEDNYIEAFESEDKKIVGIQWHMERLSEQYGFLNYFIKNI